METSGESSNPPPSKERFTKIREAVTAAKKSGITDITERREAVIDAVAKKDITLETEDIKERAIAKYLEIVWGNAKVPIIIDALHPQPIPAPIILKNLRDNNIAFQNITSQDADAYLSAINTIQDVIDGKTEGVDKELVTKIKDINNWHDANTDMIAKRVGELTGATVIVAKKSRGGADMNRRWDRRSTKEKEDYTIQATEYSRSARAALFWAMEKIFQKDNLLNTDFTLKQPMLRLSIHGMADHLDDNDNSLFDIAIGGNHYIVSPEIRQNFEDILSSEVAKSFPDGKKPKVITSYPESQDKETLRPEGSRLFSGESSNTVFRKQSVKKPNQHPSFGSNFQTLQTEITAWIRKTRNGKNYREEISLALANALIQMTHSLS